MWKSHQIEFKCHDFEKRDLLEELYERSQQAVPESQRFLRVVCIFRKCSAPAYRLYHFLPFLYFAEIQTMCHLVHPEPILPNLSESR